MHIVSAQMSTFELSHLNLLVKILTNCQVSLRKVFGKMSSIDLALFNRLRKASDNSFVAQNYCETSLNLSFILALQAVAF